jgi:hypothetical protein
VSRRPQRLLLLGEIEVVVDHLGHQRGEGGLRFPAQLLKRVARIPHQVIDLRRAEIAGIDLDEVLVVEADVAERALAEIAHRVRLAGRDDIVSRLVLLQHRPHRLDVVAGVSPVALGVEVAQVELLLQAGLDAPDGAGDLAGHERLAAAGRLVVEQDAVAREEVVALAVVHGLPEAIDLGAGVRRARVEGRRQRLRGRRRAEHLRARGLVEAHVALAGVTEMAHGIEHTKHPQARDITRIFRLFERDFDVRLGAQIVDLVGLYLVDDVSHPRTVGEVAEVEKEARRGLAGVLVQVIDAVGVEARRAPNHAVNFVAFRQQELRQIRAVLARRAREKRLLFGRGRHSILSSRRPRRPWPAWRGARRLPRQARRGHARHHHHGRKRMSGLQSGGRSEKRAAFRVSERAS